MSRRTLLVLAIFFCMLAAFSGLALGQEVTASIVGTVTDPSGAPIKGADIAATDTDRGAVWTAKTDDTGAYSLLRLPIGNYTVKVTATGFQTASHAGFPLVLNQTAKIDVQMKVGQIIIVEGKADTGSNPPKILVDTIRTEIKILEPLESAAPPQPTMDFFDEPPAVR